jgi:uncharacterized protein (TIGR02147 family)
LSPNRTIYTYGSFGEYFAEYMRLGRERNRSFSYRVLARTIKLKSPSLLAMIARGEREPTPEILHRLCEHMGLARPEARFAELLVSFKRARDINEQLRYARELKRLKPTNDELILELETLELVAKWYAIVILEMTNLPGFKDDPEWIRQRLGTTTVTTDMVREAMGTLERQGVVTRDDAGIPRKTAEVVRSTANVPSSAVRSFHKQVLQRAHSAIDRQSMSERHFTCTTVAVPRSKVATAKRLITQFREDFWKAMEDENETPEEVYHLAVQFFRSTEKPAAPAPPAALKA